MLFIKRFGIILVQFKEMGLREKVALVLTTLAITQITTTQCVPSGSRIAALQRHLEARGIKNTQSLFDNVAKVTKTSPPKRSMYKAYNFPETEYPVDSSPRDPFYYGIDPIGLAEHEAPNQNFKAFNDMRKDMRMKRKLDMINENYQTTSDPEPIWLKDKDMFPEVQYPLKSMDTWVPFYGNPSVLSQNEQRHKFSELLFEKSKRTSEPHKEDLKLKTKWLLDEINKIKEKISNSKAHSKSGTNSTGLYTTKDSPNDTKATQISFQTTDAVYNERLANLSTLKSNETEDFSKQLGIANITTISDKLPMTLNTDFDNTSVMTTPIPYKAYEWRKETVTGDLKNKDVSTFEEEPESSIILENKGNSSVQSNVSMQSINNSTYIDNTGNNFQQVLTDALIDLILTHISSKKNKKNQALVSNDTDTRTCRDFDAKSALVDEEQGENLLPNDAQKQQGIDSLPNDNPLNVKLLPASSKDESKPTHVSIKNDTQMSDVNKTPSSSIIVIPAGDSINKIQLPIVETSTATPIIVFIPTTQHGNISVSPSTNIPHAMSLISKGESNISLGNLSNIPFINESSQNADVISDLSKIQQKSFTNININTHEIRDATSIKSDFETLPNNSMCHYSTQDEVINGAQQNNDTFLDKNVSMIDIVSSHDNPSSMSLDLQSSIEPYPNTCVEEVSSDENIIAIDKLPTTEKVVANPLLLNDSINKDTKIVSTKENSSTTLKDNIDSRNYSTSDSQKNDLFKIEAVSSANAPAEVNKETDAPLSKVLASASSVSNDHQLPNQKELVHEISSVETLPDINDFSTTIDEGQVTGNVFPNETVSTTEDGMGIRNISTSELKNDIPKFENNNGFIEVNKEIKPSNKLSEIQEDADEVENIHTVLDKNFNEFNNEVLADTLLEDRNIKGRSLLDSTNDLPLNNILQSNQLKDINKDISMPIKDDLEASVLQNTLISEEKNLLSVETDANVSPSSKNNTLLTNILTHTTRNNPQLVTNDLIPNDEFVKDTQNASQVEECTDANESEDCLTSHVNQLLEQNQLINTTILHWTDSLLKGTLDKNQDLPHLGNPSPDKNEDDLDLIEDNDFYGIPFNIAKDGLSLPKGMLICSGISEVPRNVKRSSQALKQTDMTNANMESGEAISPIHKVLQEAPVAEIVKNETITKEEIRQCDELTDFAKTDSNNNKTILDTASMNKTENSASNITFDRDVEVSVKSVKESSDKKLSDAFDEIKPLVDKTNTPGTENSIPLKTDKKALENLSKYSTVIQESATQTMKSSEPIGNDLTSAELSDLIKYLYDAV